MSIVLHTDGACRGNPGPGGWAAILDIDGERIELNGASPDTTNNRMELTAAIEGLSKVPANAQVRVVSDSRYVIDGITKWIVGWRRKGWRKSDGKPVLNQDLWKDLAARTEACRASWEWIEGHTGHPENELADQLANDAIDALLR